MPSFAAVVYIHTYNITDLSALKSKNTENNLSVATNLHALNISPINIDYEYMTTKRSLQMMDNSKNICVLNRIKTNQRVKKYIFSQPINLFLGRRLYQHADFSALTGHNSIDKGIYLPDLFNERPTSKVIISGQISYGDSLDNQLAKLSEENKIIRQSSEHDAGVTRMFARGRAEFALLYPHKVFTSTLSIKH